MRNLTQNSTYNLMVFLTSQTDHVSGISGETLTVELSKNGAPFISISPSIADRSYGWYRISLTSSHTDTSGDFVLHITSANSDPTDIIYTVGGVPTTDDIATRMNTDPKTLTVPKFIGLK